MNNKKNGYGEGIETIGDIVLNLSYWDCECRDNFIHTCKEKKCAACGATQEESPNSREREVKMLVRRSNVPKIDQK
jgi:hypothetical protein